MRRDLENFASDTAAVLFQCLMVAVAFVAIFITVFATLSYFSRGSNENQRIERERYEKCLAAGGTYTTHDVDYTCTLPSKKVFR